MEDIPAVPPAELENPLEQRGFVRTLLRLGLDYAALNARGGTGLAQRARPYPDPFRHEKVRGHDGVELDAWVALLDEPAPLAVFLPGTFATKDVELVRRRLVQFPQRLGCHTVVADLRGFGGSRSAFSTAGYLERLDALEIVRGVKTRATVTRSVLIGESLGGVVSVLSSLEAPGELDAVLSWSPWADTAWAAGWASHRPPRPDPYWHVQPAMVALLRQVTQNRAKDFGEYLALAAEAAGVPLHQLVDATSIRHVVHRVPSPTLIVHALDDPIVPPIHALTLRACAGGRVRVEIQPTGSHALFHLANEDWWWTITRIAVRGEAA